MNAMAEDPLCFARLEGGRCPLDSVTWSPMATTSVLHTCYSDSTFPPSAEDTAFTALEHCDGALMTLTMAYILFMKLPLLPRIEALSSHHSH